MVSRQSSFTNSVKSEFASDGSQARSIPRNRSRGSINFEVCNSPDYDSVALEKELSDLDFDGQVLPLRHTFQRVERLGEKYAQARWEADLPVIEGSRVTRLQKRQEHSLYPRKARTRTTLLIADTDHLEWRVHERKNMHAYWSISKGIVGKSFMTNCKSAYWKTWLHWKTIFFASSRMTGLFFFSSVFRLGIAGS